MKPGDLVRVKNYFRNAQHIPEGTHGIVIEIEGGLAGIPAKNPLTVVLAADGTFCHYTAGNLEVLDEAG